MTFTQASFLQNQPDLITAVRPATRKINKKTTVCIPEAIPAMAKTQSPKNTMHASTYSLVLILLLSIVMVFLLIQSFADIRDMNADITAMQQQLDTANATEAAEKEALRQTYSGNVQDYAASQGMIPSGDAVSVVLPK